MLGTNRLAAFFALAAVAAGISCSAAPTPTGFPAEPLQTLASRAQQVSVAVRTSPQPPTRGDQSVELTITDPATGRPLPGLTLHVVPWMPVMNHGASVAPSVAETTPGTYLISNVDLFMPGEWALRTNISGVSSVEPDSGSDAGMVSDYVSPTFQIP